MRADRSRQSLQECDDSVEFLLHGPEEFYGNESFTFTSEDGAERFEPRCRERKLKVHYQQTKPDLRARPRWDAITGEISDCTKMPKQGFRAQSH